MCKMTYSFGFTDLTRALHDQRKSVLILSPLGQELVDFSCKTFYVNPLPVISIDIISHFYKEIKGLYHIFTRKSANCITFLQFASIPQCCYRNDDYSIGADISIVPDTCQNNKK